MIPEEEKRIDPAAPKYSGIESEEEHLIRNLFVMACIIIAYPFKLIYRLFTGGDAGFVKEQALKQFSIELLEAKFLKKQGFSKVFECTDRNGVIYEATINKKDTYFGIRKRD
jgi:hypothetical protein